jgi:hypothetical protein
MSATSAARTRARSFAGESIRMIQASDDGSTTSALERTHAPLRPTVYRPSRPSVTHVESGEEIHTEIFRGPALARAGIDFREPVREGSEVVAIRIPALNADDLIELRIPSTCIERARAGTSDHSPRQARGRLANSVILPHGWLLIEGSVPTIVVQTGDGRTCIEFDAPGDHALDVVLTVQRT